MGGTLLYNLEWKSMSRPVLKSLFILRKSCSAVTASDPALEPETMRIPVLTRALFGSDEVDVSWAIKGIRCIISLSANYNLMHGSIKE